MKVCVPTVKFNDAWYVWVIAHLTVPERGAVAEFYAFLGHDDPLMYIPQGDALLISEEAANKIDLLLGAHAQTIIKIWKIQRLLEHNECK